MGPAADFPDHPPGNVTAFAKIDLSRMNRGHRERNSALKAVAGGPAGQPAPLLAAPDARVPESRDASMPPTTVRLMAHAVRAKRAALPLVRH